jgi:peptidoglycan/LPS O-acetylase OafA/YrhL
MYWGFVHPQLNDRNILLALDTLLLTNATPILGSGIGMNYPSWSISSEMISYLVFGLSSMIAIRKRKPFIIGGITICCFLILAFQQNYFQTGAFGFLRGLACFNLGYFIYFFGEKKINIPNVLEWTIPLFIVALMYYYNHAVSTSALQFVLIQFLIPLTFAISIYLLIKTSGLLSDFLQSKPLLFLGKISYSVYLNHAFVIGFFIPKLFRWMQCLNGEIKKTIAISILLLILIGYSWLTQYFIENKLGKKLSGIFQ